MTSTQPRAGAARFGLLVVALAHLLATATLPFAHTHAPPGTAERVSSAPLDTDGEPQPGHTDFCTACRTLTHAQLEPVFATTAAAAAKVPVVGRTDAGILADPQVFTLAQPRAPPLA